MTPEQRRRSLRTGIILLIFVIAIMAWTFWSGFKA